MCSCVHACDTDRKTDIVVSLKDIVITLTENSASFAVNYKCNSIFSIS